MIDEAQVLADKRQRSLEKALLKRLRERQILIHPILECTDSKMKHSKRVTML
jgi:hypothetical protein